MFQKSEVVRDVPEQKKSDVENTKNENAVKMATKEPPRQLRSMAASPRQQRASRSRTSSTTSSLAESTTVTKVETPKTRSTRGSSNKDETEYKIGDLVWIKWTDARPYGAIVLGYNQELKQYKVRFAFDGVEVNRRLEHFLEPWKPEDDMGDTFQKYFDTMFKKTDSKQVHKALNAAKRTYDQAYEKHLKERGTDIQIHL